MNMSGPISFCASCLLVISETLVQVFRLPNILGRPSVSNLLTIGVVARLLFKRSADGIHVVRVSFAGLSSPVIGGLSICTHFLSSTVSKGRKPIPLDIPSSASDTSNISQLASSSRRPRISPGPRKRPGPFHGLKSYA